jgi:hypothetical protein
VYFFGAVEMPCPAQTPRGTKGVFRILNFSFTLVRKVLITSRYEEIPFTSAERKTRRDLLYYRGSPVKIVILVIKLGNSIISGIIFIIAGLAVGGFVFA